MIRRPPRYTLFPYPTLSRSGAAERFAQITGHRHSLLEYDDLLEPGGVFAIRDDHPFLGAMDFEPWQVTGAYLSGGGTHTYEDAGTYSDGPADAITSVVNHEWRHDLAEVTGALLDAGLVVEALGEHPFMDWPAFPDLVPCPEGWRLPEGSPRIPLNFSLVARRPA